MRSVVVVLPFAYVRSKQVGSRMEQSYRINVSNDADIPGS